MVKGQEYFTDVDRNFYSRFILDLWFESKISATAVQMVELWNKISKASSKKEIQDEMDRVLGFHI